MHAHVVVRTAMHAPLRAVGASWFSLVASGLTLALCALPILFATMDIALSSSLLTLVATYKETAFAVSGGLLMLAVWALSGVDTSYRAFSAEDARQYRRLRHWNRWVLKTSAVLWLIAVIGAYIAPALARH